MLSETMRDGLNDQIQAEFYSFYLYLAISAYFTTQNLDGFAHWTLMQAQEEYAHAMKLFDHINDRGGEVELLALDAPPKSWPSPAAATEAILKHERHISERINKLASLAASEHDHAATVLLHWFVNEQVEEEATADTLNTQVKMLEGSPQGMFMLDRELSARPAPAAEAGA